MFSFNLFVLLLEDKELFQIDLGLPFEFASFPIDFRIMFPKPWESKDDLLFSKSSDIKFFLEVFSIKWKLKVHIAFDCSSFVFSSVYVIGLYWGFKFHKFVFHSLCMILINENSSCSTVKKCRCFSGFFLSVVLDANSYIKRVFVLQAINQIDVQRRRHWLILVQFSSLKIHLQRVLFYFFHHVPFFFFW